MDDGPPRTGELQKDLPSSKETDPVRNPNEWVLLAVVVIAPGLLLLLAVVGLFIYYG